MVLACVKANALSRKATIFATPPVQTAISGSYILECGNLKNCKPNSHLNNIFHISNKILSHKCSKKEKKEEPGAYAFLSAHLKTLHFYGKLSLFFAVMG